MAAAEAVFKPIKKLVPQARESPTVPKVREFVSIRIDRAVLVHFQKDGLGWQDRINDALRDAVGK